MGAAVPTRHIGILGTGLAVPGRVLTNAELETMVDTSDEWIVSRTGIRERRIAEEGESSSQFAHEAALRALTKAKTAAEEIDLIICATVTPDMASCHRLPAPGQTWAEQDSGFDLSAGCSGFGYALTVAESMLRGGPFRKALVVGVICSAIPTTQTALPCALWGRRGCGSVR